MQPQKKEGVVLLTWLSFCFLCCMLPPHTWWVLVAMLLHLPPTQVSGRSSFFFGPPAKPTSRRGRVEVKHKGFTSYKVKGDMCRALLLIDGPPPPPPLSFCFVCSSSHHSGVSCVAGVCQRTPFSCLLHWAATVNVRWGGKDKFPPGGVLVEGGNCQAPLLIIACLWKKR